MAFTLSRFILQKVQRKKAKLKAWRLVFRVLMQIYEPDDLHHYLLHFLLIYQAGRFLSFSSLRQVAKPAPTREATLSLGADR
ncbi:hypothetical protein AVO44_01085 [Ruegeria profundi]|uniref:Uncharacterized protein n=1 Tax=Ruegeria profundi TaxID=1685378 RepID=A0A0X3U1G5_9RHOB|nr:hypothetical protein AVO44_01085 [Ruegeria profundi]